MSRNRSRFLRFWCRSSAVLFKERLCWNCLSSWYLLRIIRTQISILNNHLIWFLLFVHIRVSILSVRTVWSLNHLIWCFVIIRRRWRWSIIDLRHWVCWWSTWCVMLIWIFKESGLRSWYIRWSIIIIKTSDILISFWWIKW